MQENKKNLNDIMAKINTVMETRRLFIFYFIKLQFQYFRKKMCFIE